jgi:hypothetical protein
LLETYDGSIIVASSGRPGQAVASKALGLLKLDSSGKVVDGFADHGLWTPPASLADEKPLEAGEKRLTPIMMSVVGGTAAGKPLTALFGTQVEQSASTNVSIAAAQLTENGAQTFVTKSFDDASNGGDGGFPDAYPFDFAATDNGFRYANAVTQFANGTSARSYGKIAALTPSLTGPLSQKTFRIAGNFMAYDFAATPDDKYLYGCGSVSTGGINPGGGWKNYAPAIRRFKL